MAQTIARSPQYVSLLNRYHVATERDLRRAVARDFSRETGCRYTLREAGVLIDSMLEAAYQRVESGAAAQHVCDWGESTSADGVEWECSICGLPVYDPAGDPPEDQPAAAGFPAGARCESGWTGDRCTFPLFHGGLHSSD